MDEEYLITRHIVEKELRNILENKYGPQHVIDILNGCIKRLQPHAKKQEELTHA